MSPDFEHGLRLATEGTKVAKKNSSRRLAAGPTKAFLVNCKPVPSKAEWIGN